jgi:hypothetical protein
VLTVFCSQAFDGLRLRARVSELQTVEASSCENRGMSGYGMTACGVRRAKAASVAWPGWPILNLGMLFSAKCYVPINLRSMARSFSL